MDGRGYHVLASKFPQQGVLESSMSIRPGDSGARYEPPRRPPLARPRHVLALLVLVLALALLGFVGNASAQTPTVTVQFKEASYEVNEGDTLTVTVEVSGTVPSGGFTVYAMDTAIGATGMGVDYVSGPFELAFTAGDHNPSATFPLVTIGDSESDDENFAIVLSDYGLPDGVGLGTRFTTEVTINEAADDDACAPNLPSDAVTVSEVTGWRDQFSHSAHVLRWNRVLTALGQDTGETAMSASEAQAHYNQYNNTRWDRTLRTLQALEQCDSLPPDPEISIAAGSAVSEGSDATFTITATPKPSADLDVTVEVSQSGDYASTGSQTVTIPTTGSQSLTVSTTNDSTDEPDGSVTATISTGTGYIVSSSASAATVAVSDDDAPTLPEISITANGDVTEGTDASYTLTATPKPAADLDVTVEVTQTGDFVTTGSHTVTITTSGTATFTAPTTNDSTSEADGSVTATIGSGSDYTVSSSAGSATLAVSDDDGGQLASQTTIDSCVSNSVLTTVRRYYDANKNRSPQYGRNWKRVLITFRDLEDSQLTPFTAAEALAGEQVWSGWKPIREALECIEAAIAPPPPTEPEISIVGGTDVTEGTDATFTVTATPAPSADLDVTVGVTQSGDYVTAGTRTVTITTSGSATLTVSTTDDTTDEPNGSVTATISSGTGYTVSSNAGAATVAVSDDDVPEISIAAGSGVTEGTAASFTLTASPTPAADLDVTIAVSQSGDYVTTGSRTVTIPSSGSKTFTVTTTDDSDDEPDGSVTASINNGTSYTVSSSSSTATVAIADNDTCAPTLPTDAVTIAEITGWRDALDPTRAAAGIKRFNRVLATLGVDTGETPMTVQQAQAVSNWLGNTRWDRIARTLAAMEQSQCDTTPTEPEISIVASNAVTEGSDATFTVTASPAPTTALTVNLTVSQSGSFGATTGADTVTIPTSGSATYTVSTTNDSTDEPDGSVTATLSTGTGYTVSGTTNAATVAVSDDDDPPATPVISIAAGSGVTEGANASFTVTASPTPTSALTVNVTISQSGSFGATTGSRTVSIPTSGSLIFTVSTTNDSTDERDGSVTATLSTGTGYTVSGTNNAATVAVSDDDDPPAATPVISIAAGSGVTEGANASFTVTASPNPTSALTVNVTISQSGNFGATTGSRTITVPTSGSLTFTVSTSNDNTDEPNGSVTATVTTGTGYTVSTNSGAATVTVSDNDPATAGPPTVTVSDASASEGDGHLSFNVTLSHANPQTIKFRYGGFGKTASVGPDFNTEYKEFTLNAGDTTLDIDVPIYDDNEVEGDETLTIYVYAMSGITLSPYFIYAEGTIIDDDS